MKIICCAFVILLAAGILCFAHADPFDFLFGNNSVELRAAPPAPVVPRKVRHRSHRRIRHRVLARRKKAVPEPPRVAVAPPGPMPAVESDAERQANAQARGLELIRRLAQIAREQGIAAAFMLDPTLRSNDVVVMNSGLHVFVGKSADTHLAKQFPALAHSPLRHRIDLAMLQRIGHYAIAEIAPPPHNAIRELIIPPLAQR